MTVAVSFRKVSRHFGAVRAVEEVDLDIRPGEFFAMLGPSGSGKTTCLRLVAGFEQPNSGHIEIFANDKPVVTIRGHIGHADNGLGTTQYFKFGPYRAAHADDWVMYYDDFRRSPYCADVLEEGSCPFR